MEFSGSSTAGSSLERTRINEHLLPGQDLLFVDRELGPRQLQHLIDRCQLEPGYLWKRFEQLEEQRGEVQATLDTHLPEVREQSLQKATSSPSACASGPRRTPDLPHAPLT